MLQMTKPTENRLDLELAGPMDSEMMRVALDDLLAKSEGIEHGTMLYNILDFEMPTAGALGIELMRLPELFGLLRRFDKCAIVSNTTWLRTVAEFEGMLIPRLEIKAFEVKDTAAAEAWLDAF